jgi:halimadienyl-diphosphate synthase
MELHLNIHHLLKEIGSGQQITRSAYDTAWLARLVELDEPMAEAAMDWLREHQLPDGSWGTREPRYHHERLACTLAAMTAFGRVGDARDVNRLQRAQLALEIDARGLRADPAGETIGFEMIVPTLLAEAKQLGLINCSLDEDLGYLAQYRAAKLAMLPERMVNRTVTVSFSSEMVGSDGLHVLDLDNLREPNGSVAYSPAATTFFALQVERGDPDALAYLRSVQSDGAVPYIAPIEIFELAWVLWNLELTGLMDDGLLALCYPHLDVMQSWWEPGRGISACAGLTLAESDTTSMVFKVLRRFGRPADLDAVMHYEEKSHFRCFALEANPSLSANIHVLDALREAGLGAQHPAVQKVIDFLRRTQTLRMFWFDKWHASPYYPTAHAIIACMGLEDDLVSDPIYWLLTTQTPEGSWGYYMPTAEETAYCLQALVAWKRQGGQVPDHVLRSGAAWLADHAEPPYPPLWIGKCLYSPDLVVRSAILSALALVESEVSGGL